MLKKIFGLILVCSLLCACVSTGTDGSVLEHQKQIDRLESELSNRDRAIDNAVRRLEGITERSTGMEGTIDDIIELFDEYQRTVEQLLRDYRGGNVEIKTPVESIKNNVDNSGDSGIIHDCRFYMLCKGHQIATVAGYTIIEH